MINKGAPIYQGPIGQLELAIRSLLEEGDEAAAVLSVRSPDYLRLCRAQSDPSNADFFYRTAEDPRVLALKLRHKLPEVVNEGLVGSSPTTLRGAFENIRFENRPALLVAELSEAYLFFARETGRTEPQAQAALNEIRDMAGVDPMYISFYESMRPNYNNIVPRFRNLTTE